MSKSYRKPWGSPCSVRDSAHHDKTIAARQVRRAQNQSLRDALARNADWDVWLIPERYECSFNDVWGWGRDGKQRPLARSKQYNNPYAYWRCRYLTSEEEILRQWEENMKHDDDFITWASRK